MNEHDLPPHLRESNQYQRPAELELPIEPPEIVDAPPRPEVGGENERPVDPFLRHG